MKKVQTLLAFGLLFSFYLMQFGYAILACGGPSKIGGMWIITTILIVPSIVALLFRRPMGAIGACLTTLIAAIWANYHDCIAPYAEGYNAKGGAAMAYIPVLLFALPAALMVGLLTEFIIWPFLSRVLASERNRNK